MAHNQYNQYYYSQGQHQVPVPSNDFIHQYDSHQAKTPSSLDGYSPVPLRPLRTPPLRQNPSHPPQHLPDQMIYDEPGSSSNSDTSARTPDNADYDLDNMLDDVLQYPPHQDGSMSTAQTSQGAVAATDMSMGLGPWSDQDLQQAIHQTIAAQQLNPQLQMQHRQQNMLQSQPYPQQDLQNYTAHSFHHDPWNGQALRGPTVPRSSAGFFDPATDPNLQDYNPFSCVSTGWDNIESMEPHYMVSSIPNAAPPSNNPFFYSNGALLSVDTMMDDSPIDSQADPSPSDMSSNYSPLNMRSSETSPTPDSQKFVNLLPTSSYFTQNYITESQASRSRGTSVMGHPGHSPYQSAVSPLPSHPSPVTGAMLPYRNTDPTLFHDPYHQEQTDSSRALQPPSPLDLSKSRFPSEAPSQTISTSAPHSIPEVTFDHDHDEELETVRPAPLAAGRGNGGRRLGTHLPADTAKAAHDMRKIVACWHCVLQRDKCGPGDICDRCMKRSQRPNADCGLGCSRIKLVELTEQFLPTLLMQIHENQYLLQFADSHILNWHPQEITIKLTCGQSKMPRLDVRVYEFNPRDRALLEQIQYNTNPKTLASEPRVVMSPPLGMQQINYNDEKKYERYIDQIVDEGHLMNFAALCWMEDDNDFQERLFRLLVQLKPKRDDEAKLLRDCFRLIVCSFIMAHTLSMAEEHKAAALSRMRAYTNPGTFAPKFTSPRLANRQLKYFFARLQRTYLCAVLNKVQQIFKSSKGCDKWLAAFLAVIGMAMAHEDQQKTLHCVMATKAREGRVSPHDAQDSAIRAARDIDDRMHFIFQIFRWKYNRRCNPLRDADHDWEGEAGFGDATSVNFVRQVAQLVLENIDYLQGRQQVGLHPDNQGKYTSRLVGRFLLSFWLPQ